MSESVDFRLPGDENKAPGRRKGGGLTMALSGLCLALLVVLVALELLGRGGGEPGQESAGYDVAVLAKRLENRGLARAAAAAWEDSAGEAGIPEREAAMRFFRAGKRYREAGDHERALEAYYKSELIVKIDEIAAEMDRERKECFRRLGNLTGLAAEIKVRTSLAGSAVEDAEIVLAEIGSEKITLADLDRRIEEAVDARMRAYRGRMPSDALEQQKKRMLSELRSPSMKEKLLDELVSQAVLYREALKRGLSRDPEIEQELEQIRRGYFSQRLIADEVADKVVITDSDLEDHYQARLDDFRVPDRLRARKIVCNDEGAAADALEEIRSGRPFEECVAEHSVEEDRQATKGEIPGTIEKGRPVPGIGDDAALVAHLFSLEQGGVSDRPIESGGKYYLFEILEKSPARTKSFEEVKSEVERAKRAQKEAEVLEQLIARLREEHEVIVYSARLSPEAVAGEDE